MTAATATRICPPWCVSPHDEDDTFHYEAVTRVPVSGGTVNVSAFLDAKRDRPGVCIEDIEMSPAQARGLAAKLVAEADLVEAVHGER